MTEQPKDIVLSNNDMHPAEEIAHLKDLLGKANALARIRAERIKELEAHAGAEPDCRLCTHRQTWGESADPDCSLLSGCVNGSGYKPAIEIKLWRKE